MAKKKKKETDKNFCEKCNGLCCRYFALPIDTPEDRDDYDDIRWYLCHENVSVFVEDGDWYINVDNKCRHLNQETFMCDIYNQRPRICRKYKAGDCDLIEGEYDYELHFTNDRQMEEYIKVKFDNKVKKNLADQKKRQEAKKLAGKKKSK